LTLCNWCPRSANAMRHRNIIGPQVRRLRNQRGWSQEQLAAKLQIAGWDVSRNGLAKIETRIQWMRDYQLAYLLNVFRVDYADLYPTSLDPRGRYLDDRLRKLMNTRF
jgi:transcriptional regulator with XRE-family HTH domain